MEQDTTQASTGDSATSQTQDTAIPDQNIGETQDTAPVKNEDAGQSTEQPIDSKLEKAQNAARDANIENRRLKREAREREAANVQGTTPPVQQAAEPAAEDLEDILYDPAKMADYMKSAANSAILKDRKEQDEIRQTNAAKQEQNSFWSKSDELAESDSEYSELVESSEDVQMSNILKDRLMKSDIGAKLHKHILLNPDELLRINSLSVQFPAAAKKALSDLEASLSGNNSGQQQKPNITNAPPVIDQSTGGSGQIASSANAGSMVDYYVKRQAEKTAAAGR